MRFLSLIVLGVYIFSFNGVFADDFSDVKTRVNQIQNTNPALPGGGEQKGTIGTIISKLFNTSGKIKNEFLDVIDITTGKISNSYLDIFDATGDIKNDFLSFIDTSGNVKNENLSFIDNTTGNIKNENISFYNTTLNTINAESLEGLSGLAKTDTNKVIKWGDGELSTSSIYEDAGKIGIGTSSPYTKFHVAESSVSDFSGIVSSNHTDSNYAGRIYLARSRGGISTPSPLKKDDAIGLLDFAGFKGDEYYGGSFIASVATQDFTTTSAPSKLEFVTTPKGGTNYAIRMTIDDDGDVGIGTITPSQKLDVDGNINFSGDLYKNGLPYQAPGKWQDGTNTGSVYYNSGNVGIGVNSPEQKLHLDGNLRVDNGSIAIDNDNNGSFGYITEASLGGIGLVAHVDRLDSPDLYVAGSGKVGIGTTNPSNKLTLVSIGDINGVNSGGGLLIQDFSGSTDGAKLRIDANEIQVSNNGSAGHFIMNAFGGDVGIGTVSPLSKLHVNGGIVSDYVIAQDNTRYKIISGGNGTSIGGNIVLYSAGHSTTEVRNDILFRSNAINVMKIDGATGNVGIGTISPGEKFQVNGTTRISGPAPTLQFSDTDHDNYMMHVNSDRMYFMHDDNNNFSYDDGDNSRMTLMNIGARVGLGIGTTTPTTELDVRGKTRITQGSTYDIWIQGGSASSGLGRNLAILGTDNDSGDKLYINYGGEYTNGTHFNGDIAMVNGSVGVGQAPRSDARFTVNGESWFSDEIRVVGGGRGTGAPGEISFEDAGGGFASIQGYPGQNGLIFIDSPKDDELHNISLYNNSNMFYRNGQFGIGIEPNAKLDVNGNIEYTGTISDVSDRRLKTNVKDMLDGGLVGILKMRPVSFTMKDDENQKLEYGFIAQEIEEILPELVTTADDDMRTKSLNYVGIIPHLVKAVQEQQEQINLLRQEIEDLRK